MAASSGIGSRPVFLRFLLSRIVLAAGAAAVIGILVWQAVAEAGNPNPILVRSGSVAGILDIGVLVFREGLECILVLLAITAGMVRTGEPFRRPIAAGVGLGFLGTVITWFIAISIVDDLAQNLNALYIQAATGLLAIVVLLIVMNWFFHKLYWTGWISLHNRRKQQLLASASEQTGAQHRIYLGMVALGFTSFYREGVEVVLFLQSYRLKLGDGPIFYGVLLGLFFTAIVGILTFMAHRKLPYRRMLVLTGALLAAVLLVMVGEQAQEMQLAHWLPTTTIPVLANRIPAWMGMWFSVFPTVETLASQVLAAALVFGSYFYARR